MKKITPIVLCGSKLDSTWCPKPGKDYGGQETVPESNIR